MTTVESHCYGDLSKCSSQTSLLSSRLSPCLLPFQPRTRCSSLVIDKCNSTLSCGSISPVTPSCPTPKRFNNNNPDVKIFVTDDDTINNNNEAFPDLNDSNTLPATGTETLVNVHNRSSLSAPCVSRAVSQNASRTRRSPIVLLWASLSTAALGTCVGLALCLTSLTIGVSVATLGLAMILFVIYLSYKVIKNQSSSCRSGYQKLAGLDCSCSPSMPNLYQCNHEQLGHHRRGSNTSDISLLRGQRLRSRGL